MGQSSLIFTGTGVAIDGRALLIEGAPGSGKSSLALALIDRGAVLIGDDGVHLSQHSKVPSPDRLMPGGPLHASPPPNIGGLLEVRGVGLITMQTAAQVPVALILTLGVHGDTQIERLPETAETRTLLGAAIPVLPFAPGPWAPAPKAELALRLHGR